MVRRRGRRGLIVVEVTLLRRVKPLSRPQSSILRPWSILKALTNPPPWRSPALRSFWISPHLSMCRCWTRSSPRSTPRARIQAWYVPIPSSLLFSPHTELILDRLYAYMTLTETHAKARSEDTFFHHELKTFSRRSR